MKQWTTENVWKIFGVAFFIVGALVFVTHELHFSQPANEGEKLTQLQNHQQARILLGEIEKQVEVVTTPASISQGLSGRSQIGSDGMLFIFDPPREANFWMPHMKFNLDIIWITDGKIVSIDEHVLAQDPDLAYEDLPVYPSPGKVSMVLEVPAGASAEWGLQPGLEVVVMN